MELKELINSLKQFDGDWLRVNDEKCIHCFIDEYYVILCKYGSNNNLRIRVDVDNIENGQSDLIKEDYVLGSKEFELLLPIYENAKMNAVSALRSKAA